METVIQDYFNNLCCGVTYNFDVTADWATGDASYPVTDQTSFEAFLANRSYSESNDLTSIVISDFNLVGNRLQCNLTATGIILELSAMGITDCLSFGNISSLQYLYLGSNQLTTFNPTLALPSSLQYLLLNNNQLTTFNPTLALPSSLQTLDLGSNQLTTFNPTLSLPSSLQYLYLNNSQLTTAGYTASEPWATAQSAFTNTCEINFVDNPDSVSGTNLETILLTKNITIVA